jgi:hypothetical protein
VWSPRLQRVQRARYCVLKLQVPPKGWKISTPESKARRTPEGPDQSEAEKNKYPRRVEPKVPPRGAELVPPNEKPDYSVRL